MGKDLVLGTVEYCYLNQWRVTPNVVDANGEYYHLVKLYYDLLDTNKTQIDIKQVSVKVSEGLEDKASVTDILSAVSDMMDARVAADKLEYAGYAP